MNLSTQHNHIVTNNILPDLCIAKICINFFMFSVYASGGGGGIGKSRGERVVVVEAVEEGLTVCSSAVFSLSLSLLWDFCFC